MNNQLFSVFLKSKLKDKDLILKSFIFGSIAKGSQNPNDCDLFIVTNQTPFTEKWKYFINEMEQLKVEFEIKFSLKLNVTINTEKEFNELSEFKARILKGSTIEIN